MSLAILVAVGVLAAPGQVVTFTIDARPVVTEAAARLRADSGDATMVV